MLLSLIVACLVVMGSPGPSTISVTAVGAAFGLRRSLGYLSGLIAGTVAVLLAVATGVVALLLAVPRLTPVLLAASAAYILYLAYRIATASPLSKPDAAAAAPSFAGGVLLAIANPKAYVAIAAVFAGSALEPALKTAVLAVMIVLIHLVWLLAGAAFSRIFHDPLWSRRVNIAFAAALVATTAYAVL
ncbi:MAG: LysE family translocator [Reyranella sp.]|uniref:LysE family translocator n=1 Tax=Reyranella sp. TaxID=1929291 RepID=UPI0011FCAC64|nr:LysE family transporter [Reyranella sp.]TAJ41276.1 MAG: LysE family translocator [Reyranella sp.]